MKRVALVFTMLLTACMLEPPAQEMADARSALKTAQAMPGQSMAADKLLQSAERALEEAAEAMKHERYEHARSQALKARRDAQHAARMKQSSSQ